MEVETQWWMREFSELWDNATARFIFECAQCGESASRVALVIGEQAECGSDSRSAHIIAESGFFGDWWQEVGRGALADVAQALARGDARALHAVEPLWAPFYCPDCGACYCHDHWRISLEFDEDWPDWYDCATGTCPNGHSRLVDD